MCGDHFGCQRPSREVDGAQVNLPSPARELRRAPSRSWSWSWSWSMNSVRLRRWVRQTAAIAAGSSSRSGRSNIPTWLPPRGSEDITITVAGQTINAGSQIPAEVLELVDRVAHTLCAPQAPREPRPKARPARRRIDASGRQEDPADGSEIRLSEAPNPAPRLGKCARTVPVLCPGPPEAPPTRSPDTSIAKPKIDEAAGQRADLRLRPSARL